MWLDYDSVRICIYFKIQFLKDNFIKYILLLKLKPLFVLANLKNYRSIWKKYLIRIEIISR